MLPRWYHLERAVPRPAAAAEKMRKLDYDLATNTWTWIYDPDLLLTGWYHPDGGLTSARVTTKRSSP